MNPATIRGVFETVFGRQPDGGEDDRLFAEALHCQMTPPVIEACRAALALGTPALYEYFEAWDRSTSWTPGKGDRRPRDMEGCLAANGRWESAWMLARLHVDQVAKQEAMTGERIPHKGHPLCNVALLGRDLGSPAIVRHYAQLSSAGDCYRGGGTGAVAHGLAPILLEPHESRRGHERWREYVGREMAAVEPKQPLYLEAYLAARWFRGKHQAAIAERARVRPGGSPSFVEVLLNEVVNWSGADTTTQGTLFEAAAGLLLSATPGFTVYPCRWNKDDQIDLVVRYEPDALAPPALPQGFGLVECKAEKAAVSSAALRDFGAKCLFHRVQFGILVARAGIRGGGELFADPTGAELTRRRFLGDGLTLLVLDLDQLRGSDQELRGLHDPLFDDYQRLVFGRIVGEE